MAIDSRGPNDDIIIVSASEFNQYRGGGGDDRYFIDGTNALDVTITDGQGSNILALADGLSIAFAQFFTTAFQLSLSNGTTVTVNSAAENFTFELGGGPTGADGATAQSYTDFAADFDAVPAEGSATVPGGTVANDMVIGDPIVISDGDLDAVGGSLSNPTEATIAGQTAELVDDVNQQNFVKLEGFGSDDSIRFTGTIDGASVTEDDVVIDPGDDTLLTVNNGGLASQITLLGVSTGLEVQSVAEFNALGLGEILVG